MYVSDEKWNKGKNFIFELNGLVNKKSAINHKFLGERGRGFMVYFCRTYTSLTPFLKGLHLMLDSWREGRGKDGWKFPRQNVEEDELEYSDWNDLQNEENNSAIIVDLLLLKEVKNDDPLICLQN